MRMKTSHAIGKYLIIILLTAVTTYMLTHLFSTNGVNTSSIAVANSTTRDSNGNLDPYKTFQVKYPSSYYAASDDIITSFSTQGGGPAPKLVFTKTPSLNEAFSLYETWKNEEDCILVWQTFGKDASAVKDYTYGGTAGMVVKEENIMVNAHEGVRSLVEYPSRSTRNIEIFVPIEESEDSGFFFQTCNMNSENDLNVILESFRVRADLQEMGN